MKLEGEVHFDAPRDEVWASLLDPEVLAQVMPGCEKLELVGENTYEGTLKIKVGPVQGKFKGKVALSDIDAPSGYVLDVDGRGAPGFVKAKAGVQLAEKDGGTLMTYTSEAQVGGKVASVGQRLLDSSAKAIIKQSLEGLSQILALKLEPEAPEPETGDTGQATDTAPKTQADRPQTNRPRKAYKPPSQGEFALQVAKDVVLDVVPKPVLIGAAVGFVLGILMMMFRRR